jgi:MinD superfamily P-loop ATPase
VRDVKELVVCSGKGGTGKTSLVASLAALAPDPVIADCDVDAADLYLVLAPHIERCNQFYGGHEALIRPDDCSGCGTCADVCQFGAVSCDLESGAYAVDPLRCEGCGVCAHFCPERAIDFPERLCGEWYISETRYGPFVHARLAAGAENSGKLVTLVRHEARQVAQETGRSLLLVDGPPGIGCPVIASLANADAVLIVTEPSQAALHDLKRMVELARHFEIPAWICINKYDLHEGMTQHITSYCVQVDLPLVGLIPYDLEVTTAQLAGTSVIERDSTPAAASMRALWLRLREELGCA